MKHSAIFLALLSLTLFAGCKHNPNKPKENPAVASEIEEGFKQRWVEKRAADLMALGLRPDLARQQALDEFRERFSYTHAAGKQ